MAGRNQHLVAQLLLRGFATETGKHVYAFDKENCSVRPSPIAKTAFARDFYTIAGSAAMDNAMWRGENAAAPLIQQIRETESLALNFEQMGLLASFVVLQLLRTQGYRARYSDMGEQLADFMKSRGIPVPPAMANELTQGRQKVGSLQTIPGIFPDLLREFLHKSSVLYKAEGALPFWISDNPVALNNTINDGQGGLVGNLGLAVSGIEVYLPISGNLTLAYMCPSIAERFALLQDEARRIGGFIHERAHGYLGALASRRPLLLSNDEIRFQNSLQVWSAERFGYSPCDDFRDAEAMVNKSIEIRSGPRYTGGRRGAQSGAVSAEDPDSAPNT